MSTSTSARYKLQIVARESEFKSKWTIKSNGQWNRKTRHDIHAAANACIAYKFKYKFEIRRRHLLITLKCPTISFYATASRRLEQHACHANSAFSLNCLPVWCLLKESNERMQGITHHADHALALHFTGTWTFTKSRSSRVRRLQLHFCTFTFLSKPKLDI